MRWLMMLVYLMVEGCSAPGSAPGTGEPAPTSGAVAASVGTTTAPAVAPARPLTWGRLAVWRGSGPKTTDVFKVAAPWRFEWNSNAQMGLFQATAVSRGRHSILANHMVKGEAGDTTTVHTGGVVHVEIGSTGGEWVATVWALDDWFLAQDCADLAAIPLNAPSLSPLSGAMETERRDAAVKACEGALSSRAREASPWSRRPDVLALAERPYTQDEPTTDEAKALKVEGLPMEAILLRLEQINAWLQAILKAKKAPPK